MEDLLGIGFDTVTCFLLLSDKRGFEGKTVLFDGLEAGTTAELWFNWVLESIEGVGFAETRPTAFVILSLTAALLNDVSPGRSTIPGFVRGATLLDGTRCFLRNSFVFY